MDKSSLKQIFEEATVSLRQYHVPTIKRNTSNNKNSLLNIYKTIWVTKKFDSNIHKAVIKCQFEIMNSPQIKLIPKMIWNSRLKINGIQPQKFATFLNNGLCLFLGPKHNAHNIEIKI